MCPWQTPVCENTHRSRTDEQAVWKEVERTSYGRTRYPRSSLGAVLLTSSGLLGTHDASRCIIAAVHTKSTTFPDALDKDHAT